MRKCYIVSICTSSWWFISQNGNLPQIGVKIKTVWNHLLDKGYWLKTLDFQNQQGLLCLYIKIYIYTYINIFSEMVYDMMSCKYQTNEILNQHLKKQHKLTVKFHQVGTWWCFRTCKINGGDAWQCHIIGEFEEGHGYNSGSSTYLHHLLLPRSMRDEDRPGKR